MNVTSTATRVKARDLDSGDTIRIYNHLTGMPRHRKLTRIDALGDGKLMLSYEREDDHRAGKQGAFVVRETQKVYRVDE